MVARGRQHVHLDAALGHHLRRHRLDAEVDDRDGEALVAHRRHDVGRVGGDLLGERGPGHRRRVDDLGEQPLAGRARGIPGEDADPHGAALAQVAGERAGVEVADADDALGVEARPRATGATASCDGRSAGSRTT